MVGERQRTHDLQRSGNVEGISTKPKATQNWASLVTQLYYELYNFIFFPVILVLFPIFFTSNLAQYLMIFEETTSLACVAFFTTIYECQNIYNPNLYPSPVLYFSILLYYFDITYILTQASLKQNNPIYVSVPTYVFCL